MALSAVGTRRRGIDPSVSRDRVLEAAEDLILKGAFAQATVTELADLAGVSRATVFSRFGSKLGVLQELSVRCAGGPEMRAIRAAVALDDPVEAVRAVIVAGCSGDTSGGCGYDDASSGDGDDYTLAHGILLFPGLSGRMVPSRPSMPHRN